MTEIKREAAGRAHARRFVGLLAQIAAADRVHRGAAAGGRRAAGGGR
ncbi:MAG: hypothetical protein M5U08_24325 [Burkholderiales bacterium]|nr:hypothetical protein [Burkholderiales bacterium]